jgi:hypothetical protein
MQKISQLVCFIVFLILMATSCMARAAMNQAEVDERLHHVINKRSCSNDCYNDCAPRCSPYDSGFGNYYFCLDDCDANCC